MEIIVNDIKHGSFQNYIELAFIKTEIKVKKIVYYVKYSAATVNIYKNRLHESYNETIEYKHKEHLNQPYQQYINIYTTANLIN